MRRRRLSLALVVALGAAGCTGTSPQPTLAPAATPTSTPSLTPEPTARPAPTPSPTPIATTFQPILSGDAATNPACALAAPGEISAQVDAGVRELRGLTSPGAYAKTSLSCAWYLDSTAIGIPSVVVQWEFPVESYHDAVVDLYRLIIDQGLAIEVADLGDMAMLQGNTAEVVFEKRIVRVSVLQHIEPTEEDKADTVALLRLFLERTAPE